MTSPYLLLNEQFFLTHGVKAFEKMFWSQLAPAVFHIHAPVKLAFFTTWKKKSSQQISLFPKSFLSKLTVFSEHR